MLIFMRCMPATSSFTPAARWPPDIPIGANALRNSIVIDPPKRDT
jgi:hypothetical protein